jgi:uncharacterized protein
MRETLGVVGALRRYPVKSTLGTQVPVAAVTGRGLPGDRGYALVDRETGKVAAPRHGVRHLRLRPQ